MFNPFLTLYQTDQPMLPYLYDDLYCLLKNIYSVIIKPDTMEKYTTAYQLKQIDLDKDDDFLATKELNIGSVASTHIDKMKKKDEVSKKEISEFRKGVRLFVITTIKKLMERFPVGSKIVRNASIFNPCLMYSTGNKFLMSRMKILASHLEWIAPHFGDKVVS